MVRVTRINEFIVLPFLWFHEAYSKVLTIVATSSLCFDMFKLLLIKAFNTGNVCFILNKQIIFKESYY